MPALSIPWGKETLQLNLPESWTVRAVLEPGGLPPVADVTSRVRLALDNPVGLPRLSELSKPGMKITLVMDDDSRPTPVSALLPAVLEELRQAGIDLKQVTVVPALGVHRAMTEAEMRRRMGEEAFSAIRWEMHDCDNQEKLTFLGATSRGTPVYFHSTVAAADLVISVGCIEPHLIASFGGGYKNLLPGVAGRATIAHNHSINCQKDTFNNVGQPIDKNPMRLDLEEAGEMLKATVFIVNAVLDSALQVVEVVAGHPCDAHRAGVETSRRVYGVPIPTLADVLIVSSHPMDQDLRQGVKALGNNIRALKRGGAMLVLVKADEGLGVFGLANRKLPVGKGLLRRLAPLLLPLVPKLPLKGMGEEDRFFLYFALQAMLHGTLLLYAPTIPTEIHERLPFVTFVNSVEEGIALAAARFPGKADVIAIPHGGSTYPILPA